MPPNALVVLSGSLGSSPRGLQVKATDRGMVRVPQQNPRSLCGLKDMSYDIMMLIGAFAQPQDIIR